MLSDKFNYENEVIDGFFVTSEMKRAWAGQLTVLKDVDELCRKHNISYFVDWGSLIGFIRHDGFIPWDDDIDVGMSRNDFEKFRKVALKELSDIYMIASARDLENYSSLIMRIINKDGFSTDDTHLNKFCGCPYLMGIDIFAYDNIPNESEEKQRFIDELSVIAHMEQLIKNANGRSKKETEQHIQTIENLCDYKINREKNLENQIALAIEKKVCAYNHVDCEKVAIVPEWQANNRKCIDKGVLEYTVDIEIYGIKFKIPADYEQVLYAEYGEYITPYMDNEGHDYPFYNKLLNTVIEEKGVRFGEYEFNSNDLVRQSCNDIQKYTDSFLEQILLMERINVLFFKLLENGDFEEAMNLLSNGQQVAIGLGNRIEISHIVNKSEIVTKIEEYCEKLYEISQWFVGDDKDISILYSSLVALLGDIQSMIDNVNYGKRIAFVFSRKKEWEFIKGIYYNKSRDGENTVLAIQVPNYLKDDTLTISNKQTDVVLTENVEVIDFNLINYQNDYFDEIYYTDAFEKYDWASTIHPDFYSSNLQKISKKIIYVQAFDVDEFDNKSKRCMYMLDRYVCEPGVIHADEIMVPNDNIKHHYIFKLGEYSPTWNKKINIIRKLPDQKVKNKINRVLYFTNFSQMFAKKETKITLIQKQLEQFLRDGYEVDYCQDEIISLNEDTLGKDLLEKYRLFLNEQIQTKDINFVNAKDVNPENYDMYFGDRGFLVRVFDRAGIKICLNEIN